MVGCWGLRRMLGEDTLVCVRSANTSLSSRLSICRASYRKAHPKYFRSGRVDTRLVQD